MPGIFFLYYVTPFLLILIFLVTLYRFFRGKKPRSKSLSLVTMAAIGALSTSWYTYFGQEIFREWQMQRRAPEFELSLPQNFSADEVTVCLRTGSGPEANGVFHATIGDDGRATLETGPLPTFDSAGIKVRAVRADGTPVEVSQEKIASTADETCFGFRLWK